MALAVPLWIVAGRTLWGISGDLVRILALTAGPLLALLMLAAAVRITARAVGEKPFGVSRRLSLLLLGNWLAAAAFGFLVPEPAGEGTAGGSVMSVLLGEEALGFSAALCNPFGIATLGLTVAVLVAAFRNPERAGRAAEDWD